MPECTYCGSPFGDQRDHVIPSSYQTVKRTFTVGETVPCCKECNVLLGDKMFITIPERAAYLYGKYQIRYRKQINDRIMSEFELEEYGPNLKRYFKSLNLFVEYINEKVDNCKVVSNGISVHGIDIVERVSIKKVIRDPGKIPKAKNTTTKSDKITKSSDRTKEYQRQYREKQKAKKTSINVYYSEK